MSQVVLKFNLPEDKDELTLAQKGSDFWSCLRELDEECRSKLKYGHKFKTPDDVFEWVRDFIRESIELDCVE